MFYSRLCLLGTYVNVPLAGTLVCDRWECNSRRVSSVKVN